VNLGKREKRKEEREKRKDVERWKLEKSMVF